MKEKITLSVNIEPLNKINPLISRYMCNVAAVDVKAKSFVFSKEILKKLIPTLKGSPILTYYSDKDNQFAGHEGDYFVSQKTGRIMQTPELTAVGFVDYVSEPTFKIIDSKEWLTCICYLWDGRFSFLQGLSDRKDIWQSIEVGVDYNEMPDGTKVVTDAILVGLALIGISPAFEGSTFEKFSFDQISNEINLLKQEYEQFLEETSKEGDDVSKEVVENFSTEEQMSEEEMSTEEDKETKEQVNESSNEYVDNAAMEQMLENEAEENKEMIEEHHEDKDKMISDMKEKMSEMEVKMSELTEQIEKFKSDIETYVEENTKLKEFKLSIETQNKDFEVESTLKEVMDVLPQDEIDTFRLSAKEFSLENIGIWKNAVEAKAFKFSKGITENKSYLRMDIPKTDEKVKRGTGLWDN